MSRNFKKIIKRFGILCVLGIAVFRVGLAQVPETLSVIPEEPLIMAQMPWLTAMEKSGAQEVRQSTPDSSGNVTLGLWGRIPLKTVRVVNTQRESVVLCGTPFGIKMFSDGALVVGFTDVQDGNRTVNPAQRAGLKKGDLIVSINGVKIANNEDLSEIVQKEGEQFLEIVYRRKNEEQKISVKPAKGMAGYKLGIWVRDSSAGLGTMTFYEPEKLAFAGLGHAINDSDTGESISLLSGEIEAAEVIGYTKSDVGEPGELKGTFLTALGSIGEIKGNCKQGVYGVLEKPLVGEKCEIALPQEVVVGPAQILTTINGKKPCRYEVEIESVAMAAKDPDRNMMIRITDTRLLNATGGIVQGMSGSPILQNGRLVGAITHVLINDPCRGYGIFAKTMLETAQSMN